MRNDLRAMGRASTRRRGAKNRSAIYLPTRESTWTAETVRETVSLPCEGPGPPKYVLFPNLSYFPHPSAPSRPKSHRSITRRQNKPFSRRTKTRTRVMRIATHVTSSALPPIRPRRLPPTSLGPWAYRPSLCPRSSVRWRRWRATAWEPRLVVSGAEALLGRLALGAHEVRCCMRCCRISSGAC